MSADHESFLRMIGLDDGNDKRPEAEMPSEPEPQDEPSAEPQYEPEQPGEADTRSETEWELEQSLEAASPEPEPEPEPQPQQSEDRPEKTFAYSEQERVEREQKLENEKNERTERVSQVIDFRASRQSFLSLNRPNENFVENPEEPVEQTINLEPQEVSRSLQGTRPTVAFDYDEANAEVFNEQEPQKTDGTAHFDYSREQGVSRLVVLAGDANENAIHLGKFPIRIGRDFSNELILNDTNVSRFHAEIIEHEGAIIVKDIGSTNGIKVNGALVCDHILEPHDVIQIGDALIEFLPPGVLSKGVPQVSVIPNVVEGVQDVSRAMAGAVKKSRRSTIIIALATLGVVFFLFTGPLKQTLKDQSMEVVANQVKSQVDQVREQIERQHGKPIAELEDEVVAKSVISAVENSSFGELVPEGAKQQIAQLDPAVLKIFLQDSAAMAGLAFEATDDRALNKVLVTKISDLVQERKFREALTIVEMLLKWNPDDEKTKEVAQKLRANLEAETPAPNSLTLEDEKIFKEHIAKHNKTYATLLEQGQFQQAIDFSEAVSKTLIDIVEKNPFVEPLVDTEIRRWADRAEEVRKRMEEDQALKAKIDREAEEVAALIDGIKISMDVADARKARQLIDVFFKKFSKHPRASEVVQLSTDLNRALDVAFETAKTNIERFLQTEAFANAWQEYYRLNDNIPTHPRLNSLRERIEKATSSRAVQFYNQARVYEFETDDLVAAEQYYKRSMEVADPRGDLARKAERRYAEVKRKVLP